MNQELGSIKGRFYKLFPVKVYEMEVPENFVSPSLYFSEPTTFDSNDTVSSFMVTNSLSVKLFHHDSKQAFDQASSIANAIRSNRSIISLLNVDGSETGEYIRFSRIDVRRSESAVAIIILTWDSRFYYERKDVPTIDNIQFETEVKENE